MSLVKGQLPMLLALTGCGSSGADQTTSKAGNSTAEQKYVECVDTKGSAIGQPERVTKAQALAVAKACRPLLNAAAVERVEKLETERDKTLPVTAFYKAIATIQFQTAEIENEAMRGISIAVPMLPPV